MNKLVLILCMMFLVVAFGGPNVCIDSSSEDDYYEDDYKEEVIITDSMLKSSMHKPNTLNFSEPLIEQASLIKPSNNMFQASSDLLDLLFSYKPLSGKNIWNLLELNLSGCKNLTDAHVERMCKNPFFYGLTNIDFTETQVTEKSIKTILSSNIGCIRWSPLFLSDYNALVSDLTIDITISNIFKKEVRTLEKFNFRIDYKASDGSPSHYSSTQNGLRFMSITSYPAKKNSNTKFHK